VVQANCAALAKDNIAYLFFAGYLNVLKIYNWRETINISLNFM
jgi:hypothetical protein